MVLLTSNAINHEKSFNLALQNIFVVYLNNLFALISAIQSFYRIR